MNANHRDDETIEMVEKNEPDKTRDLGYTPVANKGKSNSPPRGGSATSSSEDESDKTNKKDSK